MPDQYPIEPDISADRCIARREWLTSFAVAGVAAAAAALPKHASSQAPPHASNAPELELRRIKAAVDPLRVTNYVEEGQRRGIFDAEIDDELATDINELLGTTYQALVYSELVNALPNEVRSSEPVQSSG